MASKKIDLYPTESLPAGFCYPARFLSLVNSGPRDALYPWILIDAKSDAGKLLLSLGSKGGRRLIPFASLDNGDGDAACFDGTDNSGNPAVVMLILDGSERAYSFADFNAWLLKAESDAQRWRR